MFIYLKGVSYILLVFFKIIFIAIKYFEIDQKKKKNCLVDYIMIDTYMFWIYNIFYSIM